MKVNIKFRNTDDPWFECTKCGAEMTVFGSVMYHPNTDRYGIVHSKPSECEFKGQSFQNPLYNIEVKPA